MILAEDELAIGTEHDGIMVLDDDGLGARARRCDGVLPISTDVLVLEITPNRPDCLGDLRRRPRGPRGDRGAAGAAAVGATIRARDGDVERRHDHRRVPGPVPAVHGAGVRGRQDRARARRG